MNYVSTNTCSTDVILWIIGMVISCIPGGLFIRYGWIERKAGLSSQTYLRLGLTSWILFTVSISMIGLGIFGLDDQRCSISEKAGPFLVLFCPSLVSLMVTCLFLITLWTERIRRMADEERRV